MPGALVASLLPVVRPGAPSSFMLQESQKQKRDREDSASPTNQRNWHLHRPWKGNAGSKQMTVTSVFLQEFLQKQRHTAPQNMLRVCQLSTLVAYYNLLQLHAFFKWLTNVDNNKYRDWRERLNWRGTEWQCVLCTAKSVNLCLIKSHGRSRCALCTCQGAICAATLL